MTSEVCTDDVLMQITPPHIITVDSLSGVVEARGGGQGGVGGAELGRRLLLAARAGDTTAVLDLMAKGTPFTTDWLGTSPLHLAAANAHERTCAVLLRAGVSRDARTKVDRTPLHLAAHAGHLAIVRLLLDHGASVHCRDMLRMTPLHWAAARGHEAVARELVARGADPRAICKFRKTPRCLALRAGAAAAGIVQLLDDALQRPQPPTAVTAVAAADVTTVSLTTGATKRSPLAEGVQRTQDTSASKVRQEIEKNIKIETESEGSNDEAAGGGGAAAATGSEDTAAAALLRRHGITLLPTDDGSTVLSALQSGRTVVLSDAGKLMLKESGSPGSPVVSAAKDGAGGAGGAVRGGAVLTATAVRSPLKAGVKVFTLNSLTNRSGAPLRKVISSQDLQHVKYVQLPADAKIISPSKVVPIKTRKKIPHRSPVKILMNKSNFEKLIATASRSAVTKNDVERNAKGGATGAESTKSSEDGGVKVSADGSAASVVSAVSAVSAGGGGEGGGEGEGGARGGESLRAQLALAQCALRQMAAELAQVRARLAKYEP